MKSRLQNLFGVCLFPNIFFKSLFGKSRTLERLDINKRILLSIFFSNALYLPSIFKRHALYFALFFSVFALYG